MDLKIFQALDRINSRLSQIEKSISRIDEKIDFSIQLQRNHLIRVKNGQDIDDDMILCGRPYNDLSPTRAFEIVNDPDLDFLLLDVTSQSFDPNKRFKSAVHISLEELNEKALQIQGQTTPILIISEKGIRSIQACEIMVKKGFFNVSNISGGYQFWPSRRKQDRETLL